MRQVLSPYLVGRGAREGQRGMGAGQAWVLKGSHTSTCSPLQCTYMLPPSGWLTQTSRQRQLPQPPHARSLVDSATRQLCACVSHEEVVAQLVSNSLRVLPALPAHPCPAVVAAVTSNISQARELARARGNQKHPARAGSHGASDRASLPGTHAAACAATKPPSCQGRQAGNAAAGQGPTCTCMNPRLCPCPSIPPRLRLRIR